jgi:hypothetical protein
MYQRLLRNSKRKTAMLQEVMVAKVAQWEVSLEQEQAMVWRQE